jgi:hypothetical protein
MRRRSLTIAALLAGFEALEHADAGRFGNEFLAHVIGHLYRRGESFACFSRQYDADHLAAHPRQQVVFAKALVDAHFREASLPGGDYMYQVSLAFRFRGREETLTGVAECGQGTSKDSLRGGAICAGPGEGALNLTLDGDSVLVMSIPGGADLWAPGPIDQHHDTVKNPFGPDDTSFRLVRAGLKECEDLAFNRQKPLRPHEP